MSEKRVHQIDSKNGWLLLSVTSQQTFVLMKTSSRRLDQDEYIRLTHTSSEDVFKTSSRRLDQGQYIRLDHTSSRRLQDIFKASSRRLAKTSSRHLQDIFKTSSRRLQDIFKTSSRLFIHFHCLSQYMCGHNLTMKFPPDFHNYTGLNGLVQCSTK